MEQDSSPEGVTGESNVWVQLTTETLRNSNEKLPSSKILLILGDDEADKTSLVGRLQGKTLRSKGSAMEYHFMTVRDEYCEDQTKLNIWTLEQDAIHGNLLKFILNEGSFANTTVLLAVSMTRPWEIMDRIKTWASILENHVRELDIPAEVMESHKGRIEHTFRQYVEPGFHVPSLDAEVPDDGCELKNNLGLDIMVVVAKTDHMNALITDMGYENEHFDFIQLFLRKFCLSFGASLLYLSIKDDRNCDLLSRYILHRIYGFPFRTPALLTDRDSIFIPSGWDNTNKIEILSSTLMTIAPDSPYEAIISTPSRFSRQQMMRDALPQSDEEFLAHLQAVLIQPMADAHPESAHESRSPSVVQRTGARRATRSPSKKLEPRSLSEEGDTVLHSFFKSLLNRKTSAPNKSRESANKSEVPSFDPKSMEADLDDDCAGAASTGARSKPLHLPLHRDHSMPMDFPMGDDDEDAENSYNFEDGRPFRRSLKVGVRDFSKLYTSHVQGATGMSTKTAASGGRDASHGFQPCCQPTGGIEQGISAMSLRSRFLNQEPPSSLESCAELKANREDVKKDSSFEASSSKEASHSRANHDQIETRGPNEMQKVQENKP